MMSEYRKLWFYVLKYSFRKGVIMDIKNKIIFITGANRGIGKSLVRAALEKGAKKVYATTRSKISNLEIEDERVIHFQLDITNPMQIDEVVKKTNDTQILINNAGVLSQGTILDGELDMIHYDMNANYFATINMMRAFVPILGKSQSSAMVNIISITAYANFPFIAGYSASKAALHSATQAVRIELSKKGIAVFSVNPGAIDTDMNKGSDMEMTSIEKAELSAITGIISN